MDDTNDQARERLLAAPDAVSGPVFTNQGQIDWISLAKVTVSASVAVMARLSGAGVDPFTIAVGQAVASKFKLSQLGTYRLDSTLQKLHCVSSLGDVLWFGFGINYIVRTLVKTNEGASLVMLCSSLVEVHSTYYAARVLHDLTRLYSSSNLPPGMTPSLRQWEVLVSTCSGILSASPFGELVETMMSPAGDIQVADVTLAPPRTRCRRAGDPTDVAAALKALARLSQGEIQSIVLVGGAECGWVAAVAYWFLELSIQIKDSQGELLYSGANNALSPQLTVIYDRTGDSKMQIIGQSYLVKDITRDILLKDNIDTALFTSRIPWEKAIQQTFGQLGTKLLKMNYFGTAVGSAARIFLSFSRVERRAQLQPSQLRSWTGYTDSSYGRGFLNSITKWLPETAEHRSHMEAAVDRSHEEAVAKYQTALLGIAEVCNCSDCNAQDSEPDLDSAQYRPFCMTILCETIIQMAWHLSGLRLDTSILPSRAGLEFVYHKHKTMVRPHHREHNYQDAKTLIDGLETDASLETIVCIFTGQDLADSVLLDRQFYQSRPAVVVSGLCFYRDILREISDRPEKVACIHVIPGRIETSSGRSYSYLDDTATLYTAPVIRYLASPPSSVSPSDLLLKDTSKLAIDVTPMVEELATTIEVYFHLKGSFGTADVGPYNLMRAIIHCSGLIPCARQGCSETIVSGIPMALAKGEGAIYTQEVRKAGHSIVFRRVSSDPIARSLASLVLERRRNANRRHSDSTHIPDSFILSQNFVNTGDSHQVLIQHGECTPCTVRAAVELASDDRIVYVVLR